MIKFLEEEHIEDVATAQLRAWQKAFRGILSDHQLDHLQLEDFIKSWQAIIHQTDRNNLVYLDNQERAQGFISYGPSREPFSIEAEIYGIYVHPEHWRKKIGLALMVEALLNLRSEFYSQVILWVMEKNEASRKFYAMNDFKETSERKISQRNGEEFIEIMYVYAF